MFEGPVSPGHPGVAELVRSWSRRLPRPSGAAELAALLLPEEGNRFRLDLCIPGGTSRVFAKTGGDREEPRRWRNLQKGWTGKSKWKINENKISKPDETDDQIYEKVDWRNLTSGAKVKQRSINHCWLQFTLSD